MPTVSARAVGFCMQLSEAIEKFNNWREFSVRKNTVRGYDLILRQFCVFVRNKDLEDIQHH